MFLFFHTTVFNNYIEVASKELSNHKTGLSQ